MTQQLDAPATGGPPQAHFPAVGDSIVVGIVDVKSYHQRDYDTNEPKYWPDGGIVEGKCVIGLVVSTEGTTDAGSEKSSQPVSPGDLVSFYCEGGKWFTYRDAIKEAEGIFVGDVMKWSRAEDKPPNNPRHNPQKVYVAKIRRPKDGDGDLPLRCEAKRRELDDRQLDPAPPRDEGPFDDPGGDF